MDARDRNEQTVAYNLMLERHHFSQMQSFTTNSHAVEIVFSPKCNLACKYCYVRKYWHEVYDEAMFDVDRSLRNTKKILSWMVKNGLRSKLAIFSGELFAQRAGYQLLDVILSFYSETTPDDRVRHINIPTNFTFLCNDEYTAKVEYYIDAFTKLGITLSLSASFDGKYMETNRPFAGNLDIDLNVVRDDAYYDKVFAFVKKHRFGLHPMVYSKGIERWKDNHAWFMEMIDKHKLPRRDFYMLQVRNKEWDSKSIAALYDFLRYLFRYDYNRNGGGSKAQYINYLLSSIHAGYNILRQPLVTNANGLTCSIQQAIIIRAADLTIFPCHRTMYPHLQVAHMEEDADGLLHITADKSALGIAVCGCSFKSFPVCVACPMKQFCIGPCLGANYETNRELFTPIPSVCRMQYTILRAVVDGMDELGLTYDFIKRCPAPRAFAFKTMRSIIKEDAANGKPVTN